jgi:hypothetical protein
MRSSAAIFRNRKRAAAVVTHCGGARQTDLLGGQSAMPFITPDLAALRAARALDCPVCPALAGEECVYSTAPVAVPVVRGTQVRPVRGYHAGRLAQAAADIESALAVTTGPAEIVWDNGAAPRLPDAADDVGEIDATAAALLADKITALREYVGRVLGDDQHDRAGALGRVAAELARVSVILAAATEGMDDEDDAEPYCFICGRWVHMFQGFEGWRHFRGEGTVASPVELYDPGHEAVVGWMVPAGRSLCPADIGTIRQALADAAAWRLRPSWRACEDCQRLAPARCVGHAADDGLVVAYDALLRCLPDEDAVTA